MRLIIDGVTIGWPGRPVLRGASAELHAPQRVAIMGPSGAGKSTLLAILAGQLAPSSGRVIVESDARPEWIVQASPMLLARSALANVAIGPLSRGVDPASARASALAVLDELGLGDRIEARANRLSGGERQRVAVARALAAQPTYVLADEPTASLDTASKRAVIASLARLSAVGALVVIATHDAEVAAACDRVLSLVDGLLQEQR